MRILVACEFSGVVRNAFVKGGHDAMSCDLLPSETERPDGWDGHYQGDVRDLLKDPSYEFDLMIAHPPCTYLANSGVRWLAPGGKLNQERHKLMQQACDLFAALYWADIPRVCIENPIMHRYAKDYLMSAWKVPGFTQTIQPYEHGHGETKRTALWLRGLPLLTPTKIVSEKKPRVHYESPSPDRWKNRSRTLAGIAQAFVKQWGNLTTNQPEQAG